jgi:hypothetical protein
METVSVPGIGQRHSGAAETEIVRLRDSGGSSFPSSFLTWKPVEEWVIYVIPLTTDCAGSIASEVL